MPAFPKAAALSTQNTQLRRNLTHATHTIRDKRAKVVAKGEVTRAYVLKGIAATAGAKAAIEAAGGKLAE